MSVAEASLTREARYVSIAEERCSTKGISQIVNSLLEGVFKGFEDHGIKIPPAVQSKVRSITGQKMESHLREEYVRKLVEVYKKALAGLSEAELDTVAQQPTASAQQSEAHRKFHEGEQAGFLPIKEKTIDELMVTGTKLVNEKATMEEIYKIATEK